VSQKHNTFVRSNVGRFSQFFRYVDRILSMKFATKFMPYFPPDLKCISITLSKLWTNVHWHVIWLTLCDVR